MTGVLPDDDDLEVELALTLDAWSPLHGRLRRIGPEPGCEREFQGWTGLASVLRTLACEELPGRGWSP